MRSSCQLSLPLTHGGLAVREVLCLLLTHYQFIEHSLVCQVSCQACKGKSCSQDLQYKFMEWVDKCCGEGDSTSWFAWDSPHHPGMIIASIPFILQGFVLENN